MVRVNQITESDYESDDGIPPQPIERPEPTVVETDADDECEQVQPRLKKKLLTRKQRLNSSRFWNILNGRNIFGTPAFDKQVPWALDVYSYYAYIERKYVAEKEKNTMEYYTYDLYVSSTDSD